MISYIRSHQSKSIGGHTLNEHLTVTLPLGSYLGSRLGSHLTAWQLEEIRGFKLFQIEMGDSGTAK